MTSANDKNADVALLADAPVFVREWIQNLPDTVYRVREENLVVERLVDAAGVTVTGEHCPDIWIVRNRRHIGASQLRCRVSNSDLKNVVLYLNRPAKNLVVTFNGSNSQTAIGLGGTFKRSMIVGDRTTITVGDGTTAQDVKIVTKDSQVSFGKDCMISSDVVIYAGQRHGLVDLSKDSIEFRPARSEVVLGDHVWLGYSALLVGGACIGSGSIVGAGTVAAKSFGENCVILGNPAEVRKEQITWSRTAHAIDPVTTEYINRNLGCVSSHNTNLNAGHVAEDAQ